VNRFPGGGADVRRTSKLPVVCLIACSGMTGMPRLAATGWKARWGSNREANSWIDGKLPSRSGRP
jgi:hypothetical protein